MPTFAQNFQIGDVVYGLSHSRAPYLASLGTLRAYCEDTGAFLICDSFNNRSFLGVAQPYGFAAGNVTIKSPATVQDLDFNWDYYENDRGSVALDPQVKATVTAFFDALKVSERSPYDALQAPQAKWSKSGDIMPTMLAIRRACKFGIEYMITQKHQTVHFVLDVPFNAGTSINMQDVVDKTKYMNGVADQQGSVPITFSELRCCYRNRNAWVPTGRLKFYLNLQEVQPPWVQNAPLWQEYEHARYRKKNPVRGYLASKFIW